MRPFLTTQQFIDKAKAIHGDKFDYSNTIYTSRKGSVTMVCMANNHTFTQPVSSHLSGNGCYKCAGYREDQIKNKDDFIKTANIIHHNKYDYSKTIYTKTSDKIIIICPLENHGIFPQQAGAHIYQESGCPKCAIIFRGNLCRKSTEEFIAASKIIHGDKYDYSQSMYTGIDNKIIIICKLANHGPFPQTAYDHESGRGCPKCKLVFLADKFRKPFDIFIEEANEVHDNKYDYTQFNYHNGKVKSIVICSEHGSFKISAERHIYRRQGCGSCVPKSYGEEFIINWLTNNKIEYKKEYNLFLGSSTFPKRIDFYIKSLNLFIEFNGPQHYAPVIFPGQTKEQSLIKFEEQIIRDGLLREYCENNNVNLLEINGHESGYTKSANHIIVKNYVERELSSYIFRLKSKLYFTRNKVD